MIGPDGLPLKREYVGGETGKDLVEAEMTRGFETSNGKYITVSEEELDRLAPEKSRDIDLRLFVPTDDVSPLYFNRPYFLAPADKSGKAYRLLAESMERKGRAGIATFVMHGKEYLVAILADGGILRAQTLRFADEVREPGDVGMPKRAKVSDTAVRKFEGAIARTLKKALDPGEMRDEYAAAMLKLIEKKRTHRKDVIETEPAEARRRPAKVVDLMEVLKASLGQGKKTTKRAA
jgi:DNA end-binding protein Ku